MCAIFSNLQINCKIATLSNHSQEVQDIVLGQYIDVCLNKYNHSSVQLAVTSYVEPVRYCALCLNTANYICLILPLSLY
jgi:hypothetical protein